MKSRNATVNLKFIIKYLFLFVFALTAISQPINYQGKLSDKAGAPVTGDKNFYLSIYDDKTDGKLTYEEAIGTVTLTKGIYSFNFGEDGKSVATSTETVGSTDSEKQIFNHTAANIPIVGNIKITAGDYSWSDTGGSSSSSQFTATANKETGQISAIFISGAPAAGTEITVTYDYNSTGIMGALSAGSQSWLEVTIGGETLSPRERLVAVPFALRAKSADKLNREIRVPLYVDINVGFGVANPMTGKNTEFGGTLRVGGMNWESASNHTYKTIYIPKGVDLLEVTLSLDDDPIQKKWQDRYKTISIPNVPLAISLNKQTHKPHSVVGKTSIIMIKNPDPGFTDIRVKSYSGYYEGIHIFASKGVIKIIGIYN
jgi:hypothetical protein